jgi:hypothetical protein
MKPKTELTSFFLKTKTGDKIKKTKTFSDIFRKLYILDPYLNL